MFNLPNSIGRISNWSIPDILDTHNTPQPEVPERTYVNYLLLSTMNQKDSLRQAITSSTLRPYFSPSAKLGHPTPIWPHLRKNTTLHYKHTRSRTWADKGTHLGWHVHTEAFLPATDGRRNRPKPVVMDGLYAGHVRCEEKNCTLSGKLCLINPCSLCSLSPLLLYRTCQKSLQVEKSIHCRYKSWELGKPLGLMVSAPPGRKVSCCSLHNSTGR